MHSPAFNNVEMAWVAGVGAAGPARDRVLPPGPARHLSLATSRYFSPRLDTSRQLSPTLNTVNASTFSTLKIFKMFNASNWKSSTFQRLKR